MSVFPGRTSDRPLRPWSWSALAAFETCPKQFYEVRVAKNIQETPSEELRHGNMVHQALDRRLRLKKPLPSGLKRLEPRVAALESMGGQVFAERKLAFNAKLQPVEYFAKDVWVRSVVDAGVLVGTDLLLVDWKTGKMKDDWGQLALSAALMLSAHRSVERVGLVFVWTKYDDKSSKIVTRDELPTIWGEEIMPRVRKFQEAFDKDEFPARQSGLCKKHCPVTQCVHNGRK